MKHYPRIPPDDERCSEEYVSDGTGWHFFRCKRRGVVKEDGKLWCKQHSPSAKKARKEAGAARYKAQSDARIAPYRKIERLEAINRDLLAALKAWDRWFRQGEKAPLWRTQDAIAKAELPA